MDVETVVDGAILLSFGSILFLLTSYAMLYGMVYFQNFFYAFS